VPAVFLGLDPRTCPHTYPTTRDGRCHGCGGELETLPGAIGEIRAHALDLRSRAIDPHWHEASTDRQQVETACGAIAAFLENKAIGLHALAAELEACLSGRMWTERDELTNALQKMQRDFFELAAGFRGHTRPIVK